MLTIQAFNQLLSGETPMQNFMQQNTMRNFLLEDPRKVGWFIITPEMIPYLDLLACLESHQIYFQARKITSPITSHCVWIKPVTRITVDLNWDFICFLCFPNFGVCTPPLAAANSLWGWSRGNKDVVSPSSFPLGEKQSVLQNIFWSISKWMREKSPLIFLWKYFWNIVTWRGGVVRGCAFPVIVVSNLDNLFKHG